jgi:S-adenosylmethionine synthetase
VAYAIGVAEPVSLLVQTFGTGVVSDEKLSKAIRAVFDCRPYMLIRELDLLKPIFKKTAAYGHFGRPEFSWEQTPKVEQLLAAAHSGNGVHTAAAKAIAAKRSQSTQA